MNKAVFLDRDGVINRERGEYTFKIKDFELLPGVAATIKTAKERGFKVIVISNQGGIAKGLYTVEDTDKLHVHMQGLLSKEGAPVNDIFYSPNHEVTGASLDRKPGSLLFEKAAYRHNINCEQSFMIGDSLRDIEAAEKLGITSFLIEPNSSIEFIVKHL